MLREMAYGQPRSFLDAGDGIDVVSADGERVGALRHVLADEKADIFDGLVIEVPGGHRFVDAPDVDEFYERAVVLKIPADDVQALPEPTPSPAVLEHEGGDDDEGGPLAQKLRRAWDLLSGNY
jgi:uncharacterized protein YrrD